MATFHPIPLVPTDDDAPWRTLPDRLRDQLGLPPVAGMWYVYLLTGDLVHVRLAIYANRRLAQYTYRVTDTRRYTIADLIACTAAMYEAGSTSKDEWYGEDRQLNDYGTRAFIEHLIGTP